MQFDDTPSKDSSIGQKVKGLKNLFHAGSVGSDSRKSSFSSKADAYDISSSGDEDNYTTNGFANYSIDPLDLKKALSKTFKILNNEPSSNNKIDTLLNDGEYSEYTKRPKYVKTVRKAVSTASVCKRLFLAQELDQNLSDDQHSQDIIQNDIDIQLGDTTLTKTSSSDSIGGQNLKARDKTNKKSIWALTFSSDGRYLASAGKGNEIKVWKVLSSPLERLSGKHNNSKYGSIFQPLPVKVFKGHTNDVLALDWSKNNFLLSSSMDKTVKLWNLKKTEYLRNFVHDDFVTCVKFHPLDDRFFASGCLDHKVRLWSILENEVSYEFDAKDLVTAIGFTPSGSLTIVGTFSGVIYFLETSSLEVRYSIQLTKKRSNTGPKITGIEAYVEDNDIKILVTSNDSKIRLCSLRKRQLDLYFKGPENNSSQMISTVSGDNQFVISGSENHWVYVWKMHNDKDDKENHRHHRDPLSKLLTNKKKRGDYTSFHAHHSVVTCSLFAPTATLKILSLSNDFIYELNNDLAKSGANNDQTEEDQETNEKSLFNKAHIGEIIVTADDLGLIRVFRQDLSPKVRDILEEQSSETKSSKLNKKNSSQNEHRVFLNKSNSVSTSSLLSRGRSFKKNDDQNNNITNAPNHTLSTTGTTNSGVRSRSTTVGSVSKNFTGMGISDKNSRQSMNLNMVCDVCGSEKFTIARTSKNSSTNLAANFALNNGVLFICSDCGNEIHT